jgi:hypothetical protein
MRGRLLKNFGSSKTPAKPGSLPLVPRVIPSRSQQTAGRTDVDGPQGNDGNKRQTVEIQVTHVGPDLQFATAEVAKSTGEGSKSSSDGPSAASSAETKQSA